MPRAKKEAVPETKKSPSVVQPRRSPDTDEWGGFVQVALTPLDKELYDQWFGEHSQHVNPLLDEDLGQGYKFSLTFDANNNAYIASYTGRPNDDGEALPFRCTLSARSGEMADAIALLVYKHRQVCGTDWADFLINGKRVSNWG